MDNFELRLKNTKNFQERIALLDDPKCPSWLVKVFCLEDVQLEVILAASKHKLCLPIWKNKALERIHTIVTQQAIKKIKNHDYFEKIKLIDSLDCPSEILKKICLEDDDDDIVRLAVKNTKCDPEWVNLAIERFPEFLHDGTLEIRNKRIELFKLKAEIDILGKDSIDLSKGDRDQIILEHIRKRDKIDHATSHLGVFEENLKLKYIHKNTHWAETTKFRIAMIMAPAWGILFPPYNIAKLTGMLRKHDYSVKVYDANIEAFHYLEDLHGEDYWRSERYFLWSSRKNFENLILPHLRDLFFRIIQDVVLSKPKVIGFSMYATNKHATYFLIKEIRHLMPEVCIVVGGPEIVTGSHLPDFVNYAFVGEAEENFLNLLENLPETYPTKQFIGNTSSKLDLDIYAYPDYSDYVLSNYLHADGVSIETSRGCVAQCSFCAETYFWKFRSMTPERVVTEMEFQIKNHAVSRFWFVDSLVNGNLKNFKRLVELINEKQLNINWNSYARCDGRMDLSFIQQISESGCTCLSFGVESGSQKVLYDMRKKIEIWEIENNLKDCHNSGIFTHVNWMVGFPTEEPIDQLHSWQLLYNCRRYIASISPGFGAGPGPATHLETNWKDYQIQWNERSWDNTFLNTWWTKDYNNTLLHRFLRLKLTHIWFEIIKDYSDSIIINSQRYDNIKDFYKLSIKNNKKIDYIKYDNYVNLKVLNDSEFKNSIANEYFTFAYCLWIHYGAFDFEIYCNMDEDKKQFGDFLTTMYYSKFKFSIDDSGNFTSYLEHNFNHDTVDDSKKKIYETERGKKDQSFNADIEFHGSINDWKSETIQVKETIHEQYREKKKIFKIVPVADSL